MSIFDKLKKLVNEKVETLSQLNTGWDGRPYDFYLIFGQIDETKSPWITTNWKSDFEPYFDILIKQAGHANNTGIKVIKYNPEKRVSKKDGKEFIYHSQIKLGRLKWDDKSHDKWTTPGIANNYFRNFELWAPIWTICEKRQSPPEIFIIISNERDFEDNREIEFGYFIVVAIAKNLKLNSKPILTELSERINSKATILKTRTWGKTENVENWTFVNWIQDTFSNGIYKGQSLHSVNFNDLEFEPAWEIIYKQA